MSNSIFLAIRNSMINILLDSGLTCNPGDAIFSAMYQHVAGGESIEGRFLMAEWNRAVGEAIGEHIANWYETPESERHGDKPNWCELISDLVSEESHIVYLGKYHTNTLTGSDVGWDNGCE